MVFQVSLHSIKVTYLDEWAPFDLRQWTTINKLGLSSLCVQAASKQKPSAEQRSGSVEFTNGTCMLGPLRRGGSFQPSVCAQTHREPVCSFPPPPHIPTHLLSCPPPPEHRELAHCQRQSDTHFCQSLDKRYWCGSLSRKASLGGS